MQKDTHTWSNNSIGNAAKDYPLGSHNPLFHDWNSPESSNSSNSIQLNEPDFLVLWLTPLESALIT